MIPIERRKKKCQFEKLKRKREKVTNRRGKQEGILQPRREFGRPANRTSAGCCSSTATESDKLRQWQSLPLVRERTGGPEGGYWEINKVPTAI